MLTCPTFRVDRIPYQAIELTIIWRFWGDIHSKPLSCKGISKFNPCIYGLLNKSEPIKIDNKEGKMTKIFS